MPQAQPATRHEAKMSLPLHIATALAVMFSVLAGNPIAAQDRNAVAERLAKGIASSNIHKIYVPDFPDAAGQPSGPGAFFAANFSKLIAAKSQAFAVQNRQEAHEYLLQSSLTDYVLNDATNLGKFTSQFDVDAILFGSVKSSESAQNIQFTLRDPAGKVLFADAYDEPAKLSEGNFPPSIAASGWPYYIGGLDGISFPSCFYMPNPPYPEKMRMTLTSGTVLVSGVINPEGKIEALRVVKSPDKKLDQLTLYTIKTWRCKPATDPKGKPVPVRIPFEITFRIY